MSLGMASISQYVPSIGEYHHIAAGTEDRISERNSKHNDYVLDSVLVSY